MRAGSVILGVVALAGAAAAFWLLSPRGERSLETEGPPTRPEPAPEAPHLQGKPATPAAAEASKEATSAWVRVLRRDDAPVSGARIDVREGNLVHDLQRAASSSGVTDAAGLAVVRARPGLDWASVYATGHEGAPSRLGTTSLERPQVLRVHPADELRLRLVRPDGAPAAGASALLFGGRSTGDATHATANAEGHVAWPARPTAVTASVLAWDPRDDSRAYVRLADVPTDGTIVLRVGIAVDVLVLGPEGEPVAEAVVELRCQGAVVETVPAPGGRARVHPVEHATDPAWVVARSGALRGAVRVVRTDTPVEVRLRAPFALEVRVSDAATRAPLAGAEVVPFGADQAGPVRTGEDGTARLAVPALDVDPETAAVEHLVVRAKGYAEAIRFVFGARPSKPIEIPMARARLLRVLVLDGAGSPVGGAQVLLLDSRPTYALDASAAVRLAPERTTDTSGVAEIDGLRLDTRVDVIAFAPSRGWASTQVGPGEDPGELKLVLVPGRSLSVHVSDPEGAPVPGARVASLRSRTPPLGGLFVDSVCAGTTDGAGIADLREVPAGSEELTVSADGWFQRRVPFEPAAPRVDVTLLRRAAIEGRIEGVAARTDGAAHRIRAMPVGRANPYDVDRASFSPPNALADDTGRFRLDGCMPGTEYVVSIVGLSDENAGPGTVRVVAPATDVVLRGADAQWARVVLVFPEADTPRGVHVEANGRDRSGKPVILRLAAPPKLSDATFELQLPHGEVALRVTAMDACTWMDDVRVVEDGQRVSVPIRTAPRLSVHVVDPRGEPVVDAEVRLEIAPTQPLDAAGRPRPHLWGNTARTSPDGTCTLPPPWHRFRLSVWKDRASHTTPERGVDETDPLRIVFNPLATPPPRAPDADGGR